MSRLLKPYWPVLNRSHPLARGLVGAWTFAERGGAIAFDVVGTGGNGTLGGTATPTRSVERYGASLTFSNGSVSIPDTSVLNPTRLSIVAGIVCSSVASARVIVGKYKVTSPFNGYALRVAQTTGKFGMWVGGSAWTEGANNIADGLFHIVIGTYDGAKVQTYVDGVAGTAQAQTANLTYADPLYIGNQNGGALPFVGSISFVYVYDRTLTPSEALRISIDPFAMLRPLRRIYKAPAAAAGFNPAWARNSNTVIISGARAA